MPAGTGNANFLQAAVLNNDNSLQSRNIDGNQPGQHLARVDQSSAPDGGGVYYTLSDRLNSVRDVVDTTGTVQDAIDYDAFGNIPVGNQCASDLRPACMISLARTPTLKRNYNTTTAAGTTTPTGRWIERRPPRLRRRATVSVSVCE